MVNLDTDTKKRFDDLQPDDCTQAEFVALLLDHYQLTDENGDPVVREIIDRMDELEKGVLSKVEIAAYRGTKEAHIKYNG
jgi:hypothetical protein